MKVMNKSKMIALISLLLVSVMLLSACGGKEKDPNESESNASTASDTVSEDGVGGDSSTDTGSGGSNGLATGSNGGGNTGGNTGGGNTGGNNGGGTTQTGSTVFAKDYLSTIPASVKQKGVHVLMWREFDSYEKQVVDAFQKKTGMKVRTTITTEDEYVTKLISLVTGSDAPDVFMMDTDFFPTAALKVGAALNKTTFRLDDPIWYKSYMDAFAINGNYYSVAVNGSFSCEDTNYVTYYRPSVLKASGITTMPYDLYKQGKWTWDKELEYARTIKKNNSKVTPISIQDKDLYMLSAGTNFVSFDGKQFTNNLKSLSASSPIVDAWKQYTTIVQENLNSKYIAYGEFAKAKIGLMTGIVYGITKDGWFKTGLVGSLDDICIVPMAGKTAATAHVPVIPKTWACAKSAKNQEGAAFFLRYFLDPANTNQSFYINNQCKEVFQLITSSKAKKTLPYKGAVNYVNKWAYFDVVEAVGATTPANVYSVLDSKKSSLDGGINRVNAELKRIVK